MKTVSLSIDGRKVVSREGANLLRVALDNGIYIPNLCALRDNPEPAAACRLCFVEVEGGARPVTACTEEVGEGMVVTTRGETALRLARACFELIMASHPVDCARCLRNRTCDLQKIARHLGVSLKTRRLRTLLRGLPVDDSSPEFTYDANKCVLCGRCLWACRASPGKGILGFAHRAFERRVTTFADEPLGSFNCGGCARCVAVCPTGAVALKEHQRTPEKARAANGS